jgi:hypothetical protein
VTTPHDRGGPRAPWLVVLLVVLSGASIMGWAIYQLLRTAISQ